MSPSMTPDPATPEPPAPPASLAEVLRRIPALDWVMLVLAVASLGLLGWEWLWPLDEAQLYFVFGADTTICAVFALEFLWRWRRAGWTWAYVRRNWYDVLGMIPVQHPALRAFRLLRVLRVVVLVSRVGMAVDRTLGDEYFYRFTSRLKRDLVSSISGAVTLAVLEEVEQVLHKGTYTANVVKALDRNRPELRRLILDKVKQDPTAGRFRRIPFYDDIMEAAVDAALRVSSDLLRDPRADRFVADVLFETLDQIRSTIAVKEAVKESEHEMQHHREPR
ncbi:ion transporter [Hydrocarboniphaga effusa]|uniref:ion transporter n=2 Tax=Hydrocarboniphaga effusa TaxID=243629 RepID=UPI003BA99F79